MIEPGEIYMADLDIAGKHRIIVVSREDLNRGNWVLGIMCTSTRFAVRKTLANCVPFQAGQFGFTTDCVAQCENVLSVHKSQLAGAPLGKLDDVNMREIIKAVGYVMDSDCEPN
jgi:mRNA-degrading endonuclease toxin of MazEF toxin-antitoxin module